MKNTNWFILEPGQVVSFIYKSQTGDKTSARRTVICLDPRYRYRKQSTGRVVEYFIGLEIDNSLKPTIQPAILKQLFEILGENVDIISDDTNEEARMKKIYLELKQFLNRNPMFKTYFYRECRKRRVFLEDKYASLNKLQIKQISDNLINQNKDSIEDME
jgi:hypothetical protein